MSCPFFSCRKAVIQLRLVKLMRGFDFGKRWLAVCCWHILGHHRQARIDFGFIGVFSIHDPPVRHPLLPSSFGVMRPADGFTHRAWSHRAAWRISWLKVPYSLTFLRIIDLISVWIEAFMRSAIERKNHDKTKEKTNRNSRRQTSRGHRNNNGNIRRASAKITKKSLGWTTPQIRQRRNDWGVNANKPVGKPTQCAGISPSSKKSRRRDYQRTLMGCGITKF